MLVNAQGQPFASVPPRPRANFGGGVPTQPYRSNIFPYNASDIESQELGGWFPTIHSPDNEINQFRDRMVARTRDLTRNDGWANGGITRILDNTVGAHMRLSANPDYRALSRFSSAFDAVWANEFRQAVESLWRSFSEGLGHYNDVSRQLTFSQQMRLAMRHKLIDGESLLVNYWLPDRMQRGHADYATSFLVVDPDRLSNPYQQVDTKYMRGGVEIDDYGVPLAYHIRKAHQNDWYNAVESMEWERIEREDPDGWRRVLHDFDRDRAGQNRGLSVFTPVLSHAKMLAKYYGIELQAATVATIFGTYVTSPYDPEMIGEAMTSDFGELGAYQQMRADWHDKRPTVLGGVTVPTLAPGESINQVAAAHPHDGFADFSHEMLRCIAAAMGISAEQITQDWSKTNYSSARAALLESWKTLGRRTTEFKVGTCTPAFATFLQEAMDRGDLDDVLPHNAPDFIEASTAYSRCDWLGVARGWVDPVKEKQGAQLGMEIGVSTLKRECAEQGLDWEEVIAQRAIEVQAFKDAGLPVPEWAAPATPDPMADEDKPDTENNE